MTKKKQQPGANILCYFDLKKTVEILVITCLLRLTDWQSVHVGLKSYIAKYMCNEGDERKREKERERVRE
jgi:hypothetical protein